YPIHKGLQTLVKDLNHLYKNETGFYENQFNPNGFEWVEADDKDNSVFIYSRKGKKQNDVLMVILNLTPRVIDYKVGVDKSTKWEVIFNSDDEKYGGSNVQANIFNEVDEVWKDKNKTISINLPALSGVVLRQSKVISTKKSKLKIKK
ncbi:alpha amylase C-terminal domain-containing protein, partial [Chryseobacterium sp.]